MSKSSVYTSITLLFILIIVSGYNFYDAKCIVMKMASSEKVFFLNHRAKYSFGDINYELKIYTNNFTVKLDGFMPIHICEVWNGNPPDKNYFSGYQNLLSSPHLDLKLLGNIALYRISEDAEKKEHLKNIHQLHEYVIKQNATSNSDMPEYYHINYAYAIMKNAKL